MIEKLKLSDFDILGIISLNDVQGIEKYVTPVIHEGKVINYLSRSEEYYNVKKLTNLALEREELKYRLTNEASKRNFVILENMLNCSAKVYYKKMEKYVINKKQEEKSDFEQAEKCLMEDMQNLVRLIEGIQLQRPKCLLPVGFENCTKRPIEMDNKAMLYLFASSLDFNFDAQDTEVLNPGYGSVYIGPILKCMYGYDYTNLLKSKYIKETGNPQIELDIKNRLSSDRISNGKKNVLLLDDNVGTGNTIKEIVDELKNIGVENIVTGAVQFNWRNYYRVTTGEKKDIEKFDIEKYDILSPINYAGHKLFEHAIDFLHSSGQEYINYLNGKKYRREDMDDIKGALYRGIMFANALGIKLSDKFDMPVGWEKTNDRIQGNNEYEKQNIIKKSAKDFIDRIVYKVSDFENKKEKSMDDDNKKEK